jgi:hypothetical protein
MPPSTANCGGSFRGVCFAMDNALLTVTATAAIPVGIFGWMMLVASLALLTNGESPRAVLAMPRTIIRNPRQVRPDDEVGD